jgi:hypothetical protein
MRHKKLYIFASKIFRHFTSPENFNPSDDGSLDLKYFVDYFI